MHACRFRDDFSIPFGTVSHFHSLRRLGRLTDRTRTSESGLNNRIVKSDILALNSSETGDGEKEDVRSLCLRNLKSPSQKTFVCAHSERISNRARSSVIQGVDGDDETDS